MTQQSSHPGAAQRWPNFYVVGAPKCGTTSLYHLLRRHPEVFLPDVKEPHYFGEDLTWRKRVVSRDIYRGLYADAADTLCAGDCSVFYLMSKTAAREIHAVRPDAKIIVMLRDPMKMLPALQRQALKTGDETMLDLGDALDAEAGRRRDGSGIADENAGIEEILHYSEIAAYSTQIDRYLQVFGRENVHAVLFDEFVADEAMTFAKICSFLGIDPGFAPEIRTHNTGRIIRSAPIWRLVKHPPAWIRRLWRTSLPGALRGPLLRGAARLYSKPAGENELPSAVKVRIREMYLADVQALSGTLGRDLSHWLKV